jgi:hypothetical protein
MLWLAMIFGSVIALVMQGRSVQQDGSDQFAKLAAATGRIGLLPTPTVEGGQLFTLEPDLNRSTCRHMFTSPRN